MRWVGGVAASAALVVLPSCASETVRISYRPVAGDVAVYRTSVRAVTVTAIGDQAPRRRVVTSVLTVRQRVLEPDVTGSRVEVRLTRADAPAATFVVHFDRAGQLTEVQRIEGLPADALGDLGLSELVPVAAAAPPRRPLAPGDVWAIDGPVTLATGAQETARLVGRGRLVALGVADGRRVAKVESTYRLPVRRTSEDTGGRLSLEGSLATRARVAYDLDDDEVASVEARSTGRYSVTLLPPAGVVGVPVPGTLDVDVTSTSRRVG